MSAERGHEMELALVMGYVVAAFAKEAAPYIAERWLASGKDPKQLTWKDCYMISPEEIEAQVQADLDRPPLAGEADDPRGP